MLSGFGQNNFRPRLKFSTRPEVVAEVKSARDGPGPLQFQVGGKRQEVRARAASRTGMISRRWAGFVTKLRAQWRNPGSRTSYHLVAGFGLPGRFVLALAK